jgi:hypothetical protein
MAISLLAFVVGAALAMLALAAVAVRDLWRGW